MVGRLSTTILLLAGLLVLALGVASSARAVTIAPPWCGTPEPDAAAALPDGSNPGDPVGSFAHIPYYALGCTLEAIAAESIGRMTVEMIGHSAQGRPMYAATVNALDTQRSPEESWPGAETATHSRSTPPPPCGC